MVRIVALAIVLLVAGAGYFVVSRIHAVQLAHDQHVGDVETHITDVKVLQASYERHNATMGHLWDEADDARRTALQLGDQRGSSATDSVLAKEKVSVDAMDAYATQAGDEESAALAEFGDRYGPASIATAKTDLAGALQQIHDEAKTWNKAMADSIASPSPDAYYVNDTNFPQIKAEYEAAEQSGSNGNAARDSLQADWDALLAKMKTEMDSASGELSK